MEEEQEQKARHLWRRRALAGMMGGRDNPSRKRPPGLLGGLRQQWLGGLSGRRRSRCRRGRLAWLLELRTLNCHQAFLEAVQQLPRLL